MAIRPVKIPRVQSSRKLRLTVKTRDVDKGFSSIVRNIQALDGKVVKVGVLKRDFKDSYKSGTWLGEAAIRNEYGIGVAERSFLRSTFDSRNKKWTSKISTFMKKGNLESSTFDRRVLIFSGKMMRDNVKRTIQLKSSPPNKASTIRRKGFNNPLIHTRKLYNKVAFETGSMNG